MHDILTTASHVAGVAVIAANAVSMTIPRRRRRRWPIWKKLLVAALDVVAMNWFNNYRRGSPPS